MSMKAKGFRALSLAALVLASGCASMGKSSGSGAEQTVPLIGSYSVHRFNFDNGLRLLVVEDHSSPTFAYQTWFRVGSRDEIPGRTGLAHLFEHMMFKETKNFKEGEFDHILESAGAEGENAFTSWDYTAYVQEMPKDKLDLIAKLESDRMVNLVVNEQSFKTELEVVQNERRYRNENNPDGLVFQELMELAYDKHSYHWPVIGYQEDLNKMKASDAEEFYKAYYSPNHATIIVAGDVVPDEVYATVKKYYGGLKRMESPPHEIPAEPEQTATKRKQLKLNIQVEKLLSAYKIPDVTSPDIAALHVADAILAGGKSSRLYRTLVDTGIAGGVETETMEQKDPILFLVSANMQKGQKATRAEAIVQGEIKKLTQKLVDDKELERAKNRVNFDFYERFDSNSERANFLGRYESLTGNFQSGLDLQKRIQAVTAQDVQNVVVKYLTAPHRTVVTGVNK